MKYCNKYCRGSRCDVWHKKARSGSSLVETRNSDPSNSFQASMTMQAVQELISRKMKSFLFRSTLCGLNQILYHYTSWQIYTHGSLSPNIERTLSACVENRTKVNEISCVGDDIFSSQQRQCVKKQLLIR